MLRFYRETKATYGRGLTEQEAQDPIVRRCFAILDREFERAEQDRQADNLALAVSNALVRAFPRK